MHDMIVVGGGPAGMTAALYALRNGKTALVIEKSGFGGQITHSPRVENYPGIMQMSGNEFADKMLEQILNQGAEIELETVCGIEDHGNVKVVVTQEGSRFEGKTVVIATGVEHRTLGLEGEDELTGEGVSYCAVCDGDFFRGKSVCVAGGGNSALQEAMLLSDKCEKVTILQDMDHLTGEQKMQDALAKKANVEIKTSVKITALRQEGGALTGVDIQTPKGNKTVPCDGLFVSIGLIPRNEEFASLADLNTYGYFDADESCQTRTPGVFVAGDCRSKTVRQLTTAAADGASAAITACRYLNQQ